MSYSATPLRSVAWFSASGHTYDHILDTEYGGVCDNRGEDENDQNCDKIALNILSDKTGTIIATVLIGVCTCEL